MFAFTLSTTNRNRRVIGFEESLATAKRPGFLPYPLICAKSTAGRSSACELFVGPILIDSTMARQTPLNCSGHTRPVVDLAFSEITPDGYFLISACKGVCARARVVVLVRSPLRGKLR